MKLMTPEFDSRIADWLEDDPEKAPSIVLETVVGALPSIPQRRSWRSLLRFNQMPRFSIAAAAILVAAVGFSAWIAGNRGGTGSVPPTPTPTVAATLAPEASPRVLTGLDQAFDLPAGAYRVGDPFAVPLTFSIAGDGWRLGRLEANVMALFRSYSDRDTAFLGVFKPNKVYADPCHSEAGPVDPGSSVDDLVALLTSLPGYTTGSVTDVTLGGAVGKYFTLDNSISTDEDGCTNFDLKLATYDRFGTDEPIFSAPDGHERIWVLDVNGERVMVQAIHAGEATPQDRIETDETTESIAFD